MKLSLGRLVSVSPSGCATFACSSSGYVLPVAASTMSPTRMFSVFEYWYLLPDEKLSGWSAT